MTHHNTNNIQAGQRWTNKYQSDGVAGFNRTLEVVRLHQRDETARHLGGPRVRVKNLSTGREVLMKPEVLVSRWRQVTTNPTPSGSSAGTQ